MTNYKQLITRMADELDHYRQLLMDNRSEVHALATEARTALAEPEQNLQPIPVSERLPGLEDRNGDGEVWAWQPFDPENMDNGDHWGLAFHEWLQDEECGFTHWLPAHTLPLPS
jgi:hypothetical protein